MKSGTRLQSFPHLSSLRALFSVFMSGWLTGLGSAAQAQTLDTQQIATLNPTSPAADDRFGSAVAVSGDTLIIGARGYGENKSRLGSDIIGPISHGIRILRALGRFNASLR